MSRSAHVMTYKGWKVKSYGHVPLYMCVKLMVKIKDIKSIADAKRWIGRHEALCNGKGKRVPKMKLSETKGIRIKHTCTKVENKTFARFRFSKKRDSIVYVNRSYINYTKSGIDNIILDYPDKTEDWFDELPEKYTCPNCQFSITKTEIMNTYLFRKMGEKVQ